MGISAEYVTSNGRLKIRLDVEDNKALFDKLAKIQELFEEESCGSCGSKNLKFSHRTNSQGIVFREIRCQACRHVLKIGATIDGSDIFPRRDDVKTGKILGNNGWHDWKADRGSNPEPQSQPAARPSKPAPGPATDDVPF